MEFRPLIVVFVCLTGLPYSLLLSNIKRDSGIPETLSRRQASKLTPFVVDRSYPSVKSILRPVRRTTGATKWQLTSATPTYNPQANLTLLSQPQRALFLTASKKRPGLPGLESPILLTPQNISCVISRAISAGVCVDYNQVDALCWDKEVRESSDCKKGKQVCCVDRIQSSLDDSPCGIIDSSIRNARRSRPVSEEVVKNVCWMAFISILQNTGERDYICDAVIVNSTHIMTPSECAMKLRKESATAKKILVTIGKPVYDLRQSLDFSQARCGQEYSVLLASVSSDQLLTMLVHKGYALFQIQGYIQKDQCTCRICLPTDDDLHHLTASSTCYVSGFVNTAGNAKTKKSPLSLDLLVYRTNLISSTMCQSLLLPQTLPTGQLEKIINKLLCSISPDVSGYCVGGMGGSLTCVNDYDEHHLIGLSVQPVDCYSAPRLFRNIAGCHDTINDSSSACLLPNISLSGQSYCGKPKTNNTDDPFGLSFQTADGTAQRALNIGRRMQMLSPFPVSDAALLGRSGFGGSEISQPGLHFSHDPLDICWEVAVFNPIKGHCSGVLLTSKHVLTAAHCLTEHDGSTVTDTYLLSVFVGFNSIPRDAERDCEGIFRVKKIRVHPLYSKPSGTRFFDLSDMALVELEEAVDLRNNPCACAICLQSSKEPLPGELCTLSGFGCPAPILANEACPAPRPWSLSWANVIILGEDICSAIPHYAPQAMTCTVTDGGPSGCYGDSGGPLVCYDEDRKQHYLHGIFSFILSTTASAPQRCRTQPLTPNFYTKVINYVPWLIENVPGLEISL